MKGVRWVAICTFVVLGLAACGGGGSSDGSSASLAMKGTSGNLVNMNGTWARCERKDSEQTDTLITAALNGSRLSINMSVWDAPVTSLCQQTAGPAAVLTEQATATLGAEAAAAWTDDQGNTSPPAGVPGDALATKATLAFSSAVLTLNSTAWADRFNVTSMCGKTDWAVGIPTNILTCTSIVESTTDTDYWVVDDGSIPLKLYTQNTGTFPYQVDSKDPLVKQ